MRGIGVPMSKLWSSGIADLAPYVPGLQLHGRDVVKLNTNESPYPPSPRAVLAMQEAASASLNLYPDPRSAKLREAIADYHHVAVDQVYVGNGSDEVLAHAFVGLLRHDLPVLFPDITYGFYPVYCRFFGLACEAVPLAPDMTISLEDYDRGDNPVVFPNPNAPTGVALPLPAIADWVRRRSERPVVIDEAYVDFGAESAIPLAAECENLLVVRTMSKSRGLAGMRLGYAIGAPSLIEALNRVKDSLNSYPVGRIAQVGGIASLGDEDYFRRTVSTIVQAREQLASRLAADGFDLLPSSANFIFARHPSIDGAALTARLHERGVLVRHFGGPRTSDYIRITVGDDYQIGKLTEALAAILPR